jgi:hypothetical protein
MNCHECRTLLNQACFRKCVHDTQNQSMFESTKDISTNTAYICFCVSYSCLATEENRNTNQRQTVHVLETGFETLSSHLTGLRTQGLAL